MRYSFGMPIAKTKDLRRYLIKCGGGGAYAFIGPKLALWPKKKKNDYYNFFITFPQKIRPLPLIIIVIFDILQRKYLKS